MSSISISDTAFRPLISLAYFGDKCSDNVTAIFSGQVTLPFPSPIAAVPGPVTMANPTRGYGVDVTTSKLGTLSFRRALTDTHRITKIPKGGGVSKSPERI